VKIRIQGNSIRARLSRSEVAQLGQRFPVQQQTMFSTGSILVCIVSPEKDSKAVSASFEGTTITISLPLGEVAAWANSDQVAIEGELPIDDRNSLRLLVEKDFECLHARTDEADDAFPNPRA
jgi:hypothetical protein